MPEGLTHVELPGSLKGKMQRLDASTDKEHSHSDCIAWEQARLLCSICRCCRNRTFKAHALYTLCTRFHVTKAVEGKQRAEGRQQAKGMVQLTGGFGSKGPAGSLVGN